MVIFIHINMPFYTKTSALGLKDVGKRQKTWKIFTKTQKSRSIKGKKEER